MPKISQLTALTVPDSGDELPIVDVSTSTTKKITRENLLKGAPIPGGTEFAGSSGAYSGAIYKTTSGTYAKPADLKFVIVEVVGGGGAGGGIAATSGTTRGGGPGGGGVGQVAASAGPGQEAHLPLLQVGAVFKAEHGQFHRVAHRVLAVVAEGDGLGVGRRHGHVVVDVHGVVHQ